jgi:CRISPR-associated protein Cas1
MATLYVVEQGATLRKTGERLVVTKENETIASVPTVKVEQVVIFGNVQITTPAIVHLLLAGVDAVFLSESGRYYGRLLSAESKFGELRRAQMRLIDDAPRALRVAQAFVLAKLVNQRTFLESFRLRVNRPEVDAAIAGLADLIAHVPRTQHTDSLMGTEGRGGALYFSALRALFTEDLGFTTRIRRPPRDPVNALLSFGYTLLAYAIQSAVQTVGLDPYLGFLHVPVYSRPSLVLDLMEEFRTAIVDAEVIRMVNGRELTVADFVMHAEDPERPVLLSDTGRRRFLAAFEMKLQPKVVAAGRAAGPGPAFRRIFEQQARQIGRLALAEQTEYRPWHLAAP